ncbi:hypothetical protein [Vagococcus carniphilus]|uniref:hypothetical protein n=1 Tax=Vagococcus carniphilus TaxID=218144 RepID=UPI0028902794|nr:hypothetical protein [Vagococcus carniphilus]MDT2814538.1 hypothetical protein [Vagococcus carniphilus]MDT2864159.1 hypothetical protein [Vagococcus carniphilus]
MSENKDKNKKEISAKQIGVGTGIFAFVLLSLIFLNEHSPFDSFFKSFFGYILAIYKGFSFPILILILAIIFRKEIAGKIGDITSIEAKGSKINFAEKVNQIFLKSASSEEIIENVSKSSSPRFYGMSFMNYNKDSKSENSSNISLLLFNLGNSIDFNTSENEIGKKVVASFNSHLYDNAMVYMWNILISYLRRVSIEKRLFEDDTIYEIKDSALIIEFSKKMNIDYETTELMLETLGLRNEITHAFSDDNQPTEKTAYQFILVIIRIINSIEGIIKSQAN